MFEKYLLKDYEEFEDFSKMYVSVLQYKCKAEKIFEEGKKVAVDVNFVYELGVDIGYNFDFKDLEYAKKDFDFEFVDYSESFLFLDTDEKFLEYLSFLEKHGIDIKDDKPLKHKEYFNNIGYYIYGMPFKKEIKCFLDELEEELLIEFEEFSKIKWV